MENTCRAMIYDGIVMGADYRCRSWDGTPLMLMLKKELQSKVLLIWYLGSVPEQYKHQTCNVGNSFRKWPNDRNITSPLLHSIHQTKSDGRIFWSGFNLRVHCTIRHSIGGKQAYMIDWRVNIYERSDPLGMIWFYRRGLISDFNSMQTLWLAVMVKFNGRWNFSRVVSTSRKPDSLNRWESLDIEEYREQLKKIP